MASAPLSIERLSSVGALESLCGQWAALFEAAPAATPFQSPWWLIPWLRRVGTGSAFALALRRQGALVGLALLRLRGKELSFMGEGVSDSLDLLAEPGSERECAAEVLAYLAQCRIEWTRCVLRDLPAGSALLAAPAPEGFRKEASEESVRLYLELPKVEEGLAAAGRSRARNSSARRRRRLERGGLLSMEAAADLQGLPGFLGSLFDLHGRRWAMAGQQGVLQGSEIRAFHAEAAACFLARGMLRLWRMRYKGTDAAVLYAFSHRRRLYMYLGGFEPRLSSLSPGAHLLARVIEEAVRAGETTVVDFLRGDEPYKRLWGPSEARSFRLVLERA